MDHSERLWLHRRGDFGDASSRFRLSAEYWKMAVDSYKEMVVFHVVALIGLLSVVILDAGYPVALWMVWTELTSVLLGVESFLEVIGGSQRHAKTVEVGNTVVFIFQRVVLFVYLLWVCLDQFMWELGFVVQFVILVAGTALNSLLATDRVIEVNKYRVHVWR